MSRSRDRSPSTTVVPTTPGAVRRPRIDALLTRACRDARLVALVAGAGYGKTTALASWARQTTRGSPLCWIDAGRADWQPGGLDEVLRSTLVTADPRFGPPGPGIHDGGTRPGPRENGGGRHQRDLMVIVDNLQDVRSRQAFATLDDVIRLAPPGVTLVLASRWEPMLRLSAPRTEGRVIEVGAEDLAMDAVETRALCEASGITPDDEQVDHLLEVTRGWPVAVRLACTVVASGGDLPDGGDLTDLWSGDGSVGQVVNRYLADEVFTSLPEAWRDVLACTSILDPIHADLASELSGNDLAPAILDSVATSTGLYTPLEEAPGWVRPHRLAQAYLRTALQAGGPQRVRDLHDRAAGWFAGRGDVASALPHAIRSGKETTVRDAVDATGLAPLLCSEEHSIRLASEIALAPPSVWPNGRPLVLAIAVLASSDPPAALALLDTVDPTAMRDDADRRLWAIARCKVLRNQGRQEEARAALAAARWQGAHPTEIALRDSEFALTGVDGESCDELTRRAERALMLTRSVGADRPSLQLRVALSVLGLGRGEPRDARDHARAALELGRRFGPELELELEEARVVCVAASLELGEATGHDRCCEISTRALELGAPVHLLVAGAMTDLHHRWRAGHAPRPLLEQLGRVLGSVDLDTVYPAILFAAALLELRLAEASQDLQRVHQAAARLPSNLDGLAEAHVLRAEEQRVQRAYRQAREELGPVVAGEVATVWASTRLSALVLDGVLAHLGGGPTSASLVEAVEIASAAGRRGPFLDLGATMHETLVAGHTALPSRGGFVEDLIEELRQLGPVRIPEPLTRAEMRVLHHLESMATLQEIAAGMHLSRNTVKTHAAAIYRKLEVPSRRDAVSRAKELGLI